MTPIRIVAERIVPFWLAPEKITGRETTDATTAMGQRYRKADGTSLTQFNTGAIVVREGSVLALTECQPHTRDPSIRLAAPTKARAMVIGDIREHGPPMLAVLFKKAALDVASWVCCTTDEVVLNGPAGPEEVAALEDVALLRSLNGGLQSWRRAAALYRQARADLALAQKLYGETDKLAASVQIASDEVLDVLHRLQRVQPLAYALAEPPGARA